MGAGVGRASKKGHRRKPLPRGRRSRTVAVAGENSAKMYESLIPHAFAMLIYINSLPAASVPQRAVEAASALRGWIDRPWD
jgi:hypothetical protein